MLSLFLFAFVVVVYSPHQSPRCGVLRVEKVWKFWLPTMSVGNPAAMRQLQFGSAFVVDVVDELVRKYIK